jgi:uncharacterized protein
VKQYHNGFVGNRVLRLNVGFLLSGSAGASHSTTFDVPMVRVADDVDLRYVKGELRLSRTQEGILVQGALHVGIESECYRCLTPIERDLVVEIEELYSSDGAGVSEFGIGDDGILDLAPLLRAEAIIIGGTRVLCRADCKGLCPECGINLNEVEDHRHDEQIDPRLAKLKQLLDK